MLGLGGFFFNGAATTEIYTLSLHDALPISPMRTAYSCTETSDSTTSASTPRHSKCTASSTTKTRDRKSTRLNSSHSQISYAVFCLKKKTELLSQLLDHPVQFRQPLHDLSLK